MEEIIQTRLKLIRDSVEMLITSGKDIITKLCENLISSNEACIISHKLKAANERFGAEIFNYYKLAQSSSSDDISSFTSIQLQADEIVAEIEIRTQYLNQNNVTTSTRAHVTSRLPRMELARFDGDVLKWHQFWDQFSSNVDSREINNVDKLLYLQSVLGGEAKQAIEGLDTTSKNYEIAIDTLKERYGKPGAIVDAHYVALYRIKTASNSVKDCRNTLNEIERHLRVLKSLGEDVNHNHLRVMIMEKFPEDLIYELRMKLGSEGDSIENIRKNLEYIISARETSSRLTLKREEIPNESATGEKFTTEALHVRSDDNDTNKRLKGMERDFRNRNEGNRRVDSKKFEKFNTRKRAFDSSYRHSQQRIENTAKRFKLKCIFCEENHFNEECTKIRFLQERKNKLQGRCFNCLGESHKARECRNKRKCRHCGRFGHNRAICPKVVKERTPERVLHVNSKQTVTVLQTCIVQAYKIGYSSRYINCRILLDCGSQRSYITKKLAKDLELPTLEENLLSVFTFGSQTPQEIESPLVEFNIITRTRKTKTLFANVVPHITQRVSCPYGNIQNFPHNDLILADDGSRGDQVDILLGNDYYFSFISVLKVRVEEHLYLIKSDFGWLWSGKCPTIGNSKDQLSVLTYFETGRESGTHFYEPDLPLRQEKLKQLWELESIGITDSPKCSRDEEAVKKFNETTVYDNNRYYVKWPWTEYPPLKLTVNFGLACGRLTNLLKKLDYDKIKLYDEVLQDQLNKGIIEEVRENTLPKDHPVHYLPHHCVIQDGKSTKLRIVYDASAKMQENNSLNECLYRGPMMLEDLTGLLIRFRENKVGIVADVEKAFLQIGLQIQDRDVTRFLWIKNPNEKISPNNLQHYRFCRVPFGVISSPFLLNATIRYHLNKCTHDLNKRVAEDIYVDNLVTGAQSIEEASILYKTAKKSFGSLSMNLREWNSNSKKFMSGIAQKDCDHRIIIKVLGIEWDTERDELRLRPSYESLKDKYTKRGVLKVTASIYDPCSFVAPRVLPAKLLLQELWQRKLKWDEPLPEEVIERWEQILVQLQTIDETSIPRLIVDKNIKDPQFELHCFADASIRAYAAVIYLRSYDKTNHNGTVSFVIGKSRLAPIKDQKELQIPRLELLGAVIGNRLLEYVAKFCRLSIQHHYLWADSEIVLSWLNSDKLLPPFVDRRIKEIKKNKKLKVRYVPTDINPADKGTRAENTVNGNKFWLKGPDFLRLPPADWPLTKQIYHTQVQILAGGEGPSGNEENQVQTESGERTGIENTTNTQQEKIYKDNYLHKNAVVKLQKEHFPKEVQGIQTDLTRSLNLFKDKEGILRCGGRLGNTNWSEEKKYPILIPKDTEFTTKLIECIHKDNYHIGVGHTLAMVRNRYWIIKGRSQVQKILKNCIQCRKYGGGPYKLPLMPPLPPERVRYSNSFTFTGIDYFGPLKVQDETTEKRWVCLFTCLSIRAIHMEVVKDLTAEQCVLAIRRFIAVRGIPQVVTSDNGTQFKLTAQVLTSDYCIRNNITWRFIPQLAPWFGGFYERLIAVVKNCLKRTLDKHLLNHDQLCTVIKEIEAIVNTRPLTAVSQDLEQVLTPADFLKIGGHIVTDISEKDFLENATVDKIKLIESWKRGQVILQEYIKMFVNQYLNSLRERRGFHKQSRVVVNEIPKVGDIVQIKGDHNRAFWKVGRISEVIKGSDGQIRVAKVNLQSGENITRSIGHLFPLELNVDSTESDIPDTSPNSNPDMPTLPPGNEAAQIPEAHSSDVSRISSESIQSEGGLRSKRASALRAQNLIKRWTKQLFNLNS